MSHVDFRFIGIQKSGFSDGYGEPGVFTSLIGDTSMPDGYEKATGNTDQLMWKKPRINKK